MLLGNRAYGAWVGSEMVGVAAWSVGEAKSPTARILAVFVHPLFGGDGIGTRLTEYLEDEARAAGYRALETNATLNAIGFFEKLGLSGDPARRLGFAVRASDAHRLHAQSQRRPPRLHALTIGSGGAAEQPRLSLLTSNQR